MIELAPNTAQILILIRSPSTAALWHIFIKLEGIIELANYSMAQPMAYSDRRAASLFGTDTHALHKIQNEYLAVPGSLRSEHL